MYFPDAIGHMFCDTVKSLAFEVLNKFHDRAHNWGDDITYKKISTKVTNSST